MDRTYLIAIVMVGVFASVLTGGPPSDGPESGSASNSARSDIYEASSADGASQFAASSVGQGITLERSGDGHFYANVEVNGATIEFLVDTGASAIALSREDARRAGLATSISMPSVIGEGASGAVHGEVVMLERVSLGSTSGTDVPAVVLDSGSKSLLGQSFLSKFASVEIRGDRMILQ